MKSRSLTRYALVLVCPLFAQHAVAVTAAIPSHLEYDVLRNDEPVGQHVMDFSSAGESLQAQIPTNVAIKMAFIWFDARNVLVLMQFKGKDDASLVYELK